MSVPQQHTDAAAKKRIEIFKKIKAICSVGLNTPNNGTSISLMHEIHKLSKEN